jgi:DivIVA domain-containing protein
MRKRNEQPEDTFAEAAAPSRLTPMDVQQKEFGVTRVGGGYRMRDVDQFLDELTNSMTALVEENRRLKEQAGSGAMMGAPDLEQVSRQADEIVGRAREEAAQIVRDAHSATVAAGTVAADVATSDAGRAAVSSFLLLEREFLQSLAGLVQGHAESVKGMAREARAASSARPPTQPAAAAPMSGQDQVPQPVVEPMEVPDAVADPAAGSLAGPESEPDAEPERPEAASAADPPTESMEPVRIDEPEPASVGRADPEEAAEEGDRSLRELFWGEE